MVTLGKADLILVNGQFHTVDRENPVAEAVAVRDGKFLEVGTVDEVMQHHCDGTKVVDLKGHTAIPGLNDVAGRRPADAERAGPAHTVAPVGARGGRLD
jgi:imidazolonepropionase-like amidohydrolase